MSGSAIYTYVQNDPSDLNDPTGAAAWLVSRDIFSPPGLQVFHSFVVVAPSLGADPQARFSFGPSQGLSLSTRPFGSVVEQYGSGTLTDRQDREAWKSLSTLGSKGGFNGTTTVLVRKIDDTDATVIARGQALDKALGTVQHPGSIIYNPLGGTPFDDTGNSNSAAHDVAGQNVQVPSGVEVAPGFSHTGGVASATSGDGSQSQQQQKHTCTGSRIPQDKSIPCVGF